MTRFLALIPLAVLLAACGSAPREDAAGPGDDAAAVREDAAAATTAPDGPAGRIAYACGSPPHICVVGADGGQGGRLTGAASTDEAPDWTPDGEALVVSRHGRDSLRLYRVDAATGAAKAITPDDYLAIYGRVSPDGRRIVFVCPDAQGVGDLCVVRSDGSNGAVVVETPQDESDPDWSADGSRIVFSRYFEGKLPQILIASPNGTGERRLGDGLTPAWSPDGTTIAVAGGGIRLLDAETGQSRSLTEGAYDLEPSWSPNGRWLVFRRGEMPDASLYVVAADGTGERRLTPPGEPATLPSWSPAG